MRGPGLWYWWSRLLPFELLQGDRVRRLCSDLVSRFAAVAVDRRRGSYGSYGSRSGQLPMAGS